jgi:hypothetical protein
LNKQKICYLKTEKSELLTKLNENKIVISKLEEKAINIEAHSQNTSSDFICKFCNNKQKFDKREGMIKNNGKQYIFYF